MLHSVSLSIALLLLGTAVARPYEGEEFEERYLEGFQPGYNQNQVKKNKNNLI